VIEIKIRREAMTDQLEVRLKTLEAEFENGKKILADLEVREATVKGNLLRISGAIQVLREFVPRTDAVEIPEEPETASVAAN
jgi:hypothetical protein